MRIKQPGLSILIKTFFVKGLALILAATLLPAAAAELSPSHKRSKSDRNINAIGHRTLTKDTNFFSFDGERKLAAATSSAMERQHPMLSDQPTSAYVNGLAQRIARNSDARFPITVRIVNTDRVDAVTISGGYQYITRGLLQLLQNEGELASVLAHGIAHTALRSTTRENTRIAMLHLFDIAGASLSTSDPLSAMSASLVSIPFRQQDEFDADYFGVQYLYKSGYDPQCFLDLIPRLSQDSSYANPASITFRTLPPADDRLKALRKESSRILPKKDGAITSTPEFTAFEGHLRSLPAPSKTETTPTLRRAQN